MLTLRYLGGGVVRAFSSPIPSRKQLFPHTPPLSRNALISGHRPVAPLTKNVKGVVALFGLGKSKLPEVMQAGDPVLHEPAVEVALEEINSSQIQNAIDEMVKVMREFPAVGLAAPQIGVPLQDYTTTTHERNQSVNSLIHTNRRNRLSTTPHLERLVNVNANLKPLERIKTVDHPMLQANADNIDIAKVQHLPERVAEEEDVYAFLQEESHLSSGACKKDFDHACEDQGV